MNVSCHVGHAESLHISNDYFASGGWSAGACTSVFLASQHEGDFKAEMTAATDPTFPTLAPYLDQSSLVQAGVVWAGNAVATDTLDALGKDVRYAKTNSPLAMYRGAKDTTMTPWAQAEVQAKFNATGVRCDLFAVPGHGHGDLMPNGLVATKNGVAVQGPRVPVLNHSFTWLVEQLKLTVL